MLPKYKISNNETFCVVKLFGKWQEYASIMREKVLFINEKKNHVRVRLVFYRNIISLSNEFYGIWNVS